MRIEKTLWIGAFLIALSLLAMPMGFAKNQPPGGFRMLGRPARSSISQIYAASNPSGSCASLGLKTGAIGYAQLTNGNVLVFVQKAAPNSLLNVTVIKLGNGESDKSWVCGTTSQSIGTITTSLSGNGQLFQKYKASAGQKYVVELQDSNGNVLYATYVIAM